MKTAPPYLQDLGDRAEEQLVAWWADQLARRGSKIIVQATPYQTRDTSQLNAEFGDIWFRRTEDEFPFATIEVKATDRYPSSFSLSDVEKRTSQALWISVKGPVGIWHVATSTARACAAEHVGDDGKKYWTCAPKIEQHCCTDDILDELQIRAGENTDA